MARTTKKKNTDSSISDQITQFDCHPLKNIQHLLFGLLMLRGIRQGLRKS